MSDAKPPEPASRYGTWIPGIVLIGIGLIFLAQNYLGQEIHNWWALFILIPVFFTLERGYAIFGRAGTRKHSVSSGRSSSSSAG